MRRTPIAETLYRAFELGTAGRLNSLRRLIREEGIPELREHMRSQAFHGAIAGRQLAVLRFTLDEPCERGLVDDYLRLSACYDWPEFTREMLRRGADIESRSAIGYTPLLRAASDGHEAVAEVLLDAGADPFAVDEDGRTALHLAASGDQFLLVRRFLEIGLSPNQRAWKHGETPLHTVDCSPDNESLIRCRSTVRLLLRYGAEIEMLDNDGCTPLCSAMMHARPVVMEELIRAGADVNARGEFGRPPLFCCQYRGDLRKLKLLLAAGADVLARDDNGCTMLHATAYQPELLRFMVAQGIGVNEQAHNGDTALHWAVVYDVMESVRILAENGVDPRIRNEEGYSAIDVAILDGKAHIAHYLEEVVRVRQARQTPLDPTP